MCTGIMSGTPYTYIYIYRTNFGHMFKNLKLTCLTFSDYIPPYTHTQRIAGGQQAWPGSESAKQIFSMRIRIRIQLLFKCGSGSSLTKFVKKITLRRVFLHSRILIHKRLENLPRGKGNSLVPQAGEKSSKISGKFGLDRDQSHRAP